MANGWSAERKARQAELIRNWRPWERSSAVGQPLLSASVRLH